MLIIQIYTRRGAIHKVEAEHESESSEMVETWFANGYVEHHTDRQDLYIPIHTVEDIRVTG